MDPGLPREPGVIGLANRATGAREKYRAGAKALAIDLDAGGDRASGLRALDHDHSHANLSSHNAFFIGTGRLDDCLLSVRGFLGGITHLPFIEHLGGLMLVAGLSPTDRLPPRR